MLKRLFDIVFSLKGLIILSPIFLIVALLIKLTSKGPVFYRGIRVGKDNKLFKIFKFRTMVENAEAYGGFCTAADDPRLTKIGKVLKKYKLDELPQLVNVFLGEMSFVGPRPEVEKYVRMIEKEKRRVILSMKPGMTDLASLWNFHEEDLLKGSSNPEQTYLEKIFPEKIRLQLEYYAKQSFFLDLKIIIKSVLKIFQ